MAVIAAGRLLFIIIFGLRDPGHSAVLLDDLRLWVHSEEQFVKLVGTPVRVKPLNRLITVSVYLERRQPVWGLVQLMVVNLAGGQLKESQRVPRFLSLQLGCRCQN
jgi:Rieske Fe-S protein